MHVSSAATPSEPIARRAQLWGSPRAPAASSEGWSDRSSGGWPGYAERPRGRAPSGRDGLSEPVAIDRPPARRREPGPVVRAQIDEMRVGLVDEGPQLDLPRLVADQGRRGGGYRAADPGTGPHEGAC